MVNNLYYSMGSGPCETVPSPVNGKQKTPSGNKSIFRRISIGKSESSSLPSVESLSGLSDEFREEFRDEIDEKNNKNNSTSRFNRNAREASSHRDDIHINEEISFDPFEIIPAWGFKDGAIHASGGTHAPEEFAAFQIKSPEDFEAFQKAPKTSSSSKTKTNNHKPKIGSSRPAVTMRPAAALKLDQLSKSLTRKKNQFKYHSFTNERRVSRSKKSDEKEDISSFENPVFEDRNDIEQVDYRPEDFPSLNDGPVMNDLFPPCVRDDGQGNLIGPLLPNTKLHLVSPESPENSSFVPDFSEMEEPPCENLVLESVHLKNQHIAGEEEKVENEGEEVVYEPSEYPSEFDHSSVFSGATENLPLLRAWGMKMIDCNNCGNSKAQKKKEAKKKRAEARKKMIEDLWDRKHFYWKYESVEDQRREHLQQLDTLVFKIAPEVDDGRDEAIIEMPLGFQLSTITEGDEDVTACCSPRSMAAGSLQHDEKVTTTTPVDSLLDSTKKDEENEDEAEVEECQREPVAQVSNNEAPESPEKPKKSRRSKRRMRVLSLDEIEIRKSFDDGSKDSRGNISDITEDYLHIPFSSPLYKKVLKAFREAEAAQKEGKYETSEEMENLLHWV